MKKMSDYMGLIPTMIASTPAMAEDAAHHGEASGGLPQFDPTWWPSQIFWLALCFAVMYFFFSRKALPQISSILDNRRAKVEGDMKAAEELSAQADKIKQEYELAIKKAAAEASATMQKADEAGKAKLNAALTDFRKRYDAEVTAAETRLSQSSAKAMDEMNTIAAEIAAKAAEKIAGIPADQSQAESVVRSLSQKAKAA